MISDGWSPSHCYNHPMRIIPYLLTSLVLSNDHQWWSIIIDYAWLLISYCHIISWHKPNSCNSEHDLEHDFWHEGEHQKARFRARFVARRRAPKSTIFGRRKSTKKHDLEHDLLHEGKHRKARFVARRKTLKTTFIQNIKKSFFWLLQFLGLGRIQIISYWY